MCCPIDVKSRGHALLPHTKVPHTHGLEVDEKCWKTTGRVKGGKHAVRKVDSLGWAKPHMRGYEFGMDRTASLTPD